MEKASRRRMLALGGLLAAIGVLLVVLKKE
jgi:hypothetical protein